MHTHTYSSCEQNNFSRVTQVDERSISKASSYSSVGPNKHSLQSRVVGFMTLLMQCNSTPRERRSREEGGEEAPVEFMPS